MGTRSGSGLDGRYPYSINDPNAVTTNDNPSLGLTSSYQKVSVSDSFNMWLMFKPSISGSIWVPLGQVNWNWAAGATRTGSPNTWTVDAGSNHSQTVVNSVIHPIWTKLVVPSNYVPE